MKKIFTAVSILCLELFCLKVQASTLKLSNYVGQYQSTDQKINMLFMHTAVNVGMGASAIDDSHPIVYKNYDYYSLRVRDVNGTYNTSEIDIFIDQAKKIAIVCTGNHIPREVEAGKLFVYNQACQNNSTASDRYSFIEKKAFLFKIGISLMLGKNGNIELTGYDVESIFAIPSKQIIEKTHFLRVN